MPVRWPHLGEVSAIRRIQVPAANRVDHVDRESCESRKSHRHPPPHSPALSAARRDHQRPRLRRPTPRRPDPRQTRRPRTIEHHDRVRGNLDRHGVHILTAYVAGIWLLPAGAVESCAHARFVASSLDEDYVAPAVRHRPVGHVRRVHECQRRGAQRPRAERCWRCSLGTTSDCSVQMPATSVEAMRAPRSDRPTPWP